jgi:1-deoxy-D-xylulose-5-phosphate reductoisomerase
LELGYEAKRRGGTMPAVLNGANEIAVAQFLSGAISFDLIPEIIEKVMNRHHSNNNPSLSDVLAADSWAREEAEALCLQ